MEHSEHSEKFEIKI